MENESDFEDYAGDAVMEKLTFDKIEENSLLLGVITTVSNKGLFVGLPGGLNGIVPAKNLTGMVNFSVKDLYTIGSVVCCKVMQIIHRTFPETKSKIILSLNPKDVYCNLEVENLKNGMVLQCSVVSKEDYGYVMDTGIPSVLAFLKENKCSKYIEEKNNGEELKLGQLVPCLISKVEGKVLDLSCDPHSISTAVVSSGEIKLQSLIPGVRVEVKIKEILKKGLRVQLNKKVGFVSKFHLEQAWKCPDDYVVNERVTATVLYVDSVTDYIYFTLNSSLNYLHLNQIALKCKLGELKKATVMEIEKFSVQLKINKYRGICKKDNCPFGFESIQPGTIKKCRITGGNCVDNILFVSMDEKLLSGDYVSFHNINVGDILQGTVTGIMDNGVQVKISSNIRGFVPKIQLPDSLDISLKSLLDSEEKVSCKVLSVDFAFKKLILSMKESIVESDLPIIQDYEDAEVGLISDGVIKFTHDNYVLVRFFNEVVGAIFRKQLLIHNITNPKKQLKIGQAVTCKVVFCNPDENALHLSLENFCSKKSALTSKFEIGKVYKQCTVKKVTKNYVEVEIKPGRTIALLENFHFSDHVEICKLMASVIKEGDVLHNILAISKEPVNYISMKKSFIDEAVNKHLQRDYQPEEIVPAVILSTNNYYFVLKFANNLTGRVMKPQMTRLEISKDSVHGLSLMAKILDANKWQMQATTLIEDCSDKLKDYSVELLKNYLNERQIIIRERICKSHDGVLAKLATFKEGDVVNFVVEHKTNQGLIGEVDSRIQAIVTNQNIGDDDYTIDDTVQAVVLNVDFIEKCLELTLIPSIVESVEKSKKSKIPELKRSQEVEALVIFIFTDYVLVCLNPQTDGRLAFLPTRKHLNDYGGVSDVFVLGKTYSVIVESVENGQIIVNLSETGGKNIELKKGDQKSIARITKIRQNGLDIKFENGIVGFVSNTDVKDNLKNGTNPLEGFKIGQTVSARIYEVPESAKQIESPKKRVLCSLKNSTDNKIKTIKDFNVGEKVQGIVFVCGQKGLKLRLSKDVAGFVSRIGMPKKFNELFDDFQFKIGHGYEAKVIKNDGEKIELTLLIDDSFLPVPKIVLGDEKRKGRVGKRKNTAVDEKCGTSGVKRIKRNNSGEYEKKYGRKTYAKI